MGIKKKTLDNNQITKTKTDFYEIHEKTTKNSSTIHTDTWTLELLKKIEWKRFEEISAKLMNELGFRTETIPFGADGGIDIKLYKEDSKHPDALIQCKAWNQKIGVKPIREMLGVMTHHKVKGIFIITGDYTQEAKNFARENKIDLVDGERFLYIIKTLTEDAQKRLLNKATEGDYTTPTCASCGIKMIRKPKFWGCSHFPRCRNKIPAKQL